MTRVCSTLYHEVLKSLAILSVHQCAVVMANLFGIGIIRHDSSKMLGSLRFLRVAKQCYLICESVYLTWSPANLQILTALTCRGVKKIEIEILSFMLFLVSRKSIKVNGNVTSHVISLVKVNKYFTCMKT